MVKVFKLCGDTDVGLSTLAMSTAVSLMLQEHSVVYLSTKQSEESVMNRLYNIRDAIRLGGKDKFYYMAIDHVDDMQDLLVEYNYDYIIVDDVGSVEAYEQLNTDYDKHTTLIEVHKSKKLLEAK